MLIWIDFWSSAPRFTYSSTEKDTCLIDMNCRESRFPNHFGAPRSIPERLRTSPSMWNKFVESSEEFRPPLVTLKSALFTPIKPESEPKWTFPWCGDSARSSGQKSHFQSRDNFVSALKHSRTPLDVPWRVRQVSWKFGGVDYSLSLSIHVYSPSSTLVSDHHVSSQNLKKNEMVLANIIREIKFVRVVFRLVFNWNMATQILESVYKAASSPGALQSSKSSWMGRGSKYVFHWN